MEMNNGSLAGLSFEEADKLYPLPKHHKRGYHRKPNGESNIEFRARVEAFWQKYYDNVLLTSQSNDIHLIISHGGTINNLIKSILSLPNNSNVIFPTNDTGFHLFDISFDEILLLMGNSYEHIEKIE